jgi:multidrug efflux pump
VFIPLLFMGGQVGRLFREFAVTLSAAVMISLLISLTTTPMLCAIFLKSGHKDGLSGQLGREPGRLARLAERAFGGVMKTYEHALDWALDSKLLVMLILAFVVGLNVYLFAAAPKGFFPQQDTGQIAGGMRADQSISFQAMQGKLRQLVNTIKSDPAVDTVVGFTGGSRAGGGFMFVNLKPVGERAKGESGQAVIARLRPRLARITGVQLFLNPVQDLRMGGRSSNSTYQYTLKSDNRADLKKWATRLADAMKAEKGLTDVDTDQSDNGVETYVDIDTASAARLGISAKDIDNAMYDNFGQRQVANIYDELNQYHVIMGVAPVYAQSPEALNDVYVPVSSSTGAASTSSTGSAAASAGAVSSTSASSGTPAAPANLTAARDPSSGSALSNSRKTMVPLSAIAHFAERSTPSSVNHQDGVLATTISFNLAEGYSLSQAEQQVHEAEAAIGMPTNVRGSFEGQAKQAQQSNQQQPLLILAAIVVIYIVLGILYESLVHPVTVLSTLPSAGVGAVLALLMFHMEFSIIALIGVFLLIGIVKKNAILIIDFALEAERSRGISATEAVREACLLRFRPILMTTLAAALGALPLAIGFGEGSELRQPLGIAIIGGLVASQLLTLLTTPVVYVYIDKLRTKKPHDRELARHPLEDEPSVSTQS